MKQKALVLSKGVGAAILAASILSGCGNAESNSTAEEPTASQQTVEEPAAQAPAEVETPEQVATPATEVPTEEPAAVQETTPAAAEPEEAKPTVITQEAFHKANTLDPDWPSFKDGKFELKDGTILNADYMNYKDGAAFDYATVIYYKGIMTKIQVETAKDIEEVKKALGITAVSGETAIEQTMSGWEITFDPMFLDSNIARFPNEWD